MKKAKHYWELAAIGGNVLARCSLGASEYNVGNVSRAVKHWMIAAAAGYDVALNEIRQAFLEGNSSKNDFEDAL